MKGPLSHVRVLDLSRVLAGPWASQILADLGADVIKVERPGVGDDTRAWGPPFLKAKDGTPAGAGYFLAANRGKRSITLDLSTAQGQAIVRKMAATSDVVLENYKVGTLDRYGLGWKDLSAVNDRLIYCSVTGFGQTGPRAALPAYDFLIQAMGGLMSVTGLPDGEPGAGPQKVGVPIIDLITGVYASTAINAALAGREVSGKGRHIDIAMLDVAVNLLSNQAMNSLLSGRTPARTGNAHPNIQPQKVYACLDGDIVLVVGNDAQFDSLCTVLCLTSLSSDDRYSTNGKRVENQKTLQPMLELALRQRPRAYWLERLARAGVPAGPINTIPEALNEPQIRHRQMVKTVEHSAAGALQLVMSPFRFDGAGSNHDRPPPQLGEHTKEILAEFGIGPGEAVTLKQHSII
ncbi:CaiB/BaiF CoA-transferase family protein [Variovorax sp. J31P179]|uniref:CaiB/BaiF CoA transferase family protein n=1 Tax=Variovorax sp. J31P179 TaxID=3053508 RepID=UPI002576B8F1|nr:CaiB/BaiF CoA-transferase family protein [Variovorax sp. J31P179]MDM0085379.1 CaiB/BaiF CoA-transferase family protein [Variovorax sp. J31P179]